MGLAHSPKLPRLSGLRVTYDPANPRCYSGTGTAIKNVIASDGSTPGAVSTTTDSGRLVFDNNNTNSNQIDVSLSPNVNHEAWTLIFWAKYVALPNSNFRQFLRLVDAVNPNGVGYFFTIDTRETTNNYILGYQKDQVISSWTSTGWSLNQTTWQTGDWVCCATTYNNGVIKGYLNGALRQTSTVSQNVDLYGDISTLRFFSSNATGSLLGPTFFWEGVLTDGEVLQAYNCHKGVFQ